MSMFSEWMGEIDMICWREFGMSIHDLPDMCFRDAFEDGVNPEEFMAEELADLEDLCRLILS